LADDRIMGPFPFIVNGEIPILLKIFLQFQELAGQIGKNGAFT
jgi:hypothetical protein